MSADTGSVHRRPEAVKAADGNGCGPAVRPCGRRRECPASAAPAAHTTGDHPFRPPGDHPPDPIDATIVHRALTACTSALPAQRTPHPAVA